MSEETTRQFKEIWDKLHDPEKRKAEKLKQNREERKKTNSKDKGL